MGLAQIGLVSIAIAWIIQLAVSWKGNRNIHPAFIVVYMAGVLALAISDYMQTSVLSYFELLTLVSAGIVLLKTLKK